jgi:uncharacterized protein YgbK (DUF1537 family)
MIGVIADDLTGAAELGAAGLRHGLSAEIIVAGEIGGGADLVCVDTDSRSSTPEEAGRRAAAAAHRLMEAGATWIYKKVDSLLRGRVLAEVTAILGQFRLQRAILAPANPSLGRMIRQGQYFVGGRLLSETEFARDPEYPRTSASVLELVGPSPAFPVSVGHALDPLPLRGIVVAEAASAEDLWQWATRADPETLRAGGAEFFAALLNADGHVVRVRGEAAPPSGDQRELFVSGTTSESSRKFVRAARESGVPVFSLPLVVAQGETFSAEMARTIAESAVAALQTNPRVILSVGLPLVSDRVVAKSLAGFLVEVAELVVRAARVRLLYVDGGATAALLLRRLGWTRLNVIGELAPGVATLAVEHNPGMWLTIKPGSYSWPASYFSRVE